MVEKDWQRTVVEAAKLYGWRVKCDRNVRVQRRDGTTYFTTAIGADGIGFPDLLLLRGDRQIAAELKVGRNKATEAQEGWIEAFGRVKQSQSGIWYPDMWDEIKTMLREV